MAKNNNHKAVRYNKWGYIFLIPFVVVYLIFQLIPLISTVYNSFFENYRSGLTQIGPNFVGFANYVKLFEGGEIWIYFKNTMIMWVMGFVPQILVSLLLAAWFSNPSLRLKGQRFFKTVIYLPNLIMASAFAMLFFTLFADGGPINAMLIQAGILKQAYSFFSHAWSARTLVAVLNFLMMFDVPQILTNGTGDPMRSTMTLIMYLNKHLFSKNYGMGGALSVFLFIITGVLSLIVFRFNKTNDGR